MALSIIGLGLSDENDITIRGLETVRSADRIYLESYTSILRCSIQDLEKTYGKKILIADRETVESKAEETILKDADTMEVALLVAGDPLGATTHSDIIDRAKKRGIPVRVIPNASVLTAVGATGLQLYKFGKTSSIPFHSSEHCIDTPIQTLLENQNIGAHTLFLLDLDPPAGRFMTLSEAARILIEMAQRNKTEAFTPDTLCFGCARLGSPDQTIKAGTAEELMKAQFGAPPYCLVVPGRLHFMEEEAIARCMSRKD